MEALGTIVAGLVGWTAVGLLICGANWMISHNGSKRLERAEEEFLGERWREFIEDDTPIAEFVAELQFMTDPLGSWVLPSGVEGESTPAFEEAWASLVERSVLTGIGVDVETGWKPWQLEAA